MRGIFKGAHCCTRVSNWCAAYSRVHTVALELVTGTWHIQGCTCCTQDGNWCTAYSRVHTVALELVTGARHIQGCTLLHSGW